MIKDFALGVLVGVGSDLVLEAAAVNIVPAGIYIPNITIYPTTGQKNLPWDDAALIVITLAIVWFTRNWGFALGFLLGWYLSGLFDVYGKLGLKHR